MDTSRFAQAPDIGDMSGAETFLILFLHTHERPPLQNAVTTEKSQVHHANRHPRKNDIVVSPQRTLLSLPPKYSSSRSKGEEVIMLLDSDTGEISSKGAAFTEEKWLQAPSVRCEFHTIMQLVRDGF